MQRQAGNVKPNSRANKGLSRFIFMLLHNQFVQMLYIRWTGYFLVKKKNPGLDDIMNCLCSQLGRQLPRNSFFYRGTVSVVSNWVSQSHLPSPALPREQIVMKFCGQIGIGPQNEMNKEPGGGPGLELAPSR